MYHVQLSLAMIVALIDIERRAPRTVKDSPRWDGRTVAALERRGLVGGTPGPRSIARGTDPLARSLTAKGKAYLEMALWEAAHSNFERFAA
jgi:hypothetical protein